MFILSRNLGVLLVNIILSEILSSVRPRKRKRTTVVNRGSFSTCCAKVESGLKVDTRQRSMGKKISTPM